MGVGKEPSTVGSQPIGGGVKKVVDPSQPSSGPLMPKLHPNYKQPFVSLPIPLGNVAKRQPEDMQAARQAADFDTMKMHEFLRGSKAEMQKYIHIAEVLSHDEFFADFKHRSEHWSRDYQVQMGHRAIKRITEIAVREGWDPEDRTIAMAMLEIATPLHLHHVAHIPPILGQGTPEQIERWVGHAMDTRYIGCYAQTELGHGTNVQQLETTATFEPETDTFDIHSPTLTSTKWWIGGGGLSSTHAVVQAQLILKGKNYGPHLFFVPLRSVEDHSVLPGVVCGDIGPKIYGSYSFIDNGWIRFNHVKIPRDNMLMKNAKVTKEGEYIKPPNSKLSYGGMLFIRARMTTSSGWLFAKAVTIALRYTTVRRQFRDPEAGKEALERAVLSYPSVNRRLIPLLAKSYAFICAGQRMSSLYDELSAQLAKGDMSLLADSHVASSSLKAYITKEVLVGVEECRQALGGQGFMAYSGYSGIFGTAAPAVTYEGDNYVLMQQVGRALLKLVTNLRKDASTPTTSTTKFARALVDSNTSFRAPTSVEEWLRPSTYLEALNLRSARVLSDFEREIRLKGRRLVDLSWECVELAKSHCEVVVAQWFHERIEIAAQAYESAPSSTPAGRNELRWLVQLAQLFALTVISRNVTPLALPLPNEAGKNKGSLPAFAGGSSIIDAEAVRHLEGAIRHLVEEIQAQAIPLTDAFNFSDWELNSALGRKDGRVYETLMAEVEGNPLNHPLTRVPGAVGGSTPGEYHYGAPETGKHVVEWWHEEIKPVFLAAASSRGTPPIRGDGSNL